MGVRRQIYLDEIADRTLKDESRRTGLSVSELIRRAVQQQYGVERRLSWKEVFANPIRPNTAQRNDWVYDPLFDPDPDELIQHSEEKRPA